MNTNQNRIRFNHRFSGYICKKNAAASNSNATKEESTELPKLKNLLNLSKRNGISFNTLYQAMTRLVQTKQIQGKDKF